MIKKLIDLWYEKEKDLNNEDILNSTKKSYKSGVYNKLAYIIARDILELKDIKETSTEEDRYDCFNIEGIMTKNNIQYNVSLYGTLSYGTCSCCDLIEYLNFNRSPKLEKINMLKIVMLNIIQKSNIDVFVHKTSLDEYSQKWEHFYDSNDEKELEEINNIDKEIEATKKEYTQTIDYNDKNKFDEEMFKTNQRQYSQVLYLVLLKYFELLNNDNKTINKDQEDFLNSIISNNWSKEMLNNNIKYYHCSFDNPIENMIADFAKNKLKEFK